MQLHVDPPGDMTEGSLAGLRDEPLLHFVVPFSGRFWTAFALRLRITVRKRKTVRAKAIASRRGFGKTRHVELKFLWLQEVTTSGRVKMREGTRRAKLGRSLDEGKTRGARSMILIRGVGGRMQVSQGNKRKRTRVGEVAERVTRER